MSRWKSLDWDEVQGIPPQFQGCYAIFENKKPIYIGQSHNIASRIRLYFREGPSGCFIKLASDQLMLVIKQNIKVKISPCSSHHYRLIREQKLIEKLAPVLNRKHLGFGHKNLCEEAIKMGNLKQLQFLDTEEAAYYLRMTPAALKQCRIRGSGPPYYKLGKKVRYKIEDIERWIKEARRK